jgi:hypothetical protein
MKRLFGLLGCAAALSLTASSVAHAATFVNSQFCGGNAFTTCAFINASTSTVGGNTVLTLTVTNANGAGSGSTFTQIGVGNLGGATLVGTPTSSSGNFTFSTSPTGLSGAGIDSDVIGFGAITPNVPAHGLQPGQTVTFTFTFSGTAFDASDLQFAIHDQGGAPVGCDASTKLVINGGNGQFAANTATCGAPPQTVTPEPASMVLFGTGLVGLGGIVVRRRKNTAA